MIRRVLALLLTVLSAWPAWAGDVVLNPHHPERYVVVPGDTLWDIAKRFLRDPWLWPEIWYVNPQIENPHLIYPGDVLYLTWVNGKPQLRLQRGGGHPTVKLSPRVRVEPIRRAIPAIPIDAIRQFLTRPLVVGEHDLDRAGYIVDSPDEHLVTGAGDRVYARGIDPRHGRYDLFEPGDPYVDPATGEILGYAAEYRGTASVERFGDPATLRLEHTTREIAIGDRLLPQNLEDVSVTFFPHAPARKVAGQIISVVDGVTQIGQYQVVVINRGVREGLEPGHVLRVLQAGRTIRDPVAGGKVTLPDEDAGLLLVFRTFDRVSFGLVMEARRPMHLGDKVVSPE
ncbi:MAG: LysM peptidoglycan-binding domain-containing protein [Gammaproteobacteria bacterium]|nr:MAG: LysM peptidoglycan-binding domain-containing protein [Gammaproteobacteria bacterium]